MGLKREVLAAALTIAGLAPAHAQATVQRYVGDWSGRLEAGQTFRIILHIRTAEAGISATIDSPDQGASGIAAEALVRADSLIVSIRGAFTIEAKLRNPDTLDAVFEQNGGRVPFRLTRQAASSPPPYIEEELFIVNGPVRLAGTVTRPSSGVRLPAVLLVAGSGPLTRDGVVAGHAHLAAIADHLTRAGFVVLRYDKRGIGKSTGDYAMATTTDLTADAATALRTLERKPYVDSASVAVIGHSEGGIIAARLAGTERLKAAAILSAPAIAGEQLMLDRSALLLRAKSVADSTVMKDRELRQAMLRDLIASRDTADARARMTTTLRALVPRFSEAERMAIGFSDGDWQAFAEILIAQRAWFREWLRADPLRDFAAIKVPSLIVLGARDQQVPASLNLERLQRAVKSQTVKIEVLEDHNHLLQQTTGGSPEEYARLAEAISPTALRMVTDWLRQQGLGGS